MGRIRGCTGGGRPVAAQARRNLGLSPRQAGAVAEQQAYLAGHAGFGDYKTRFEFIDTPDATLWDVRDVILEQLYPRPKPVPVAAGSGGKAVYLICDRTDPGETERAWHLRSEPWNTSGWK